MAWLYLDRFPRIEAIDRFTSALRRLTLKLEVPDKYHETISWFFLLLIAERRESSHGSDWVEFSRHNGDLCSAHGYKPLRHYYKKETLEFQRARQSFLLPDRLLD